MRLLRCFDGSELLAMTVLFEGDLGFVVCVKFVVLITCDVYLELLEFDYC